MALCAGVRDFVFVGHCRGNDREGVGADKDFGDSGLDFRHVARDTLTTRGTGFVMSVLFECRCAGTGEGQRGVAIQAEFIGGLA